MEVRLELSPRHGEALDKHTRAEHSRIRVGTAVQVSPTGWNRERHFSMTEGLAGQHVQAERLVGHGPVIF